MAEFSPGEELLVREGFINHRTQQRRAVLRCLGCIWARRKQDDNAPFALATEVASCTNIPISVVSNNLRQLRKLDILSSTFGKEKTQGAQCLTYAPSNSYSGQLLEKVLQPVPECTTPLKEIMKVQKAQKRPTLYSPTQTVPELVYALRQERLERGIRQKNVAAVIGLEYPTFSSQEANGRMTFGTFLKYAGTLGLEVVLQPREDGTAIAEPPVIPPE